MAADVPAQPANAGSSEGPSSVMRELRSRRPSRFLAWRERGIELLLFLAAYSSVAIMAGIVFVLVFESIPFFSHVSLKEFLTDPLWTPLFADPHYGILPLVAGTLITSLVALAVAMPIGTIIAIYLSEFAAPRLREVLKPTLELLSAVPTVVYGYFGLLFVGPLLQKVIPDLGTFSMLTAGVVMGIMIIPYVSSLSEDAMRAVPMLLREGAYAMGANRITTALKVVYPAAFSGIVASYVLAISRAVGETMIVAILAGQQPNLTADPRQEGATITAFIVQVSLGDLPHGGIGYQSIFAAGLVLFLMTLLFNVIGAVLRRRFREVY
jgi:phosphate transport system permease protein